MRRPALLRGVLEPHRRVVALTVLAAGTAAGAGVGLIGVAGWLLTGAALSSAGLGFNLFAPSALVRGLSFTRILARYGERLVGHDFALRLVADLRDRLFRRLAHVPATVDGQGRLGDVVSRVLPEAQTLDAMFFGVVGPVAAALLTGAAVGAVIAVQAPPAGAVYLIGFVVAGLCAPALLLALDGDAPRVLLEARAELRSLVLDAAAGHADLIVFGRRESANRSIERVSGVIARLERRRAAAAAIAGSAVGLLGGLTGLAVFVEAADAASGPMLVGMTLASLASFETAAALVRCADRVALSLAAAKRIEALVRVGERTAREPTTAPLPVGADLSFDEVSFSRHAGRPIFRGASLACAAGTRTAILGESGSGKSTLFDLALHLVEPASGSVRVAGTDIADVAKADLHARVALMAQSAPVFLGTIRENLRLGRPDAEDALLWDALRRARLDATVADMPDGLDTWCGEGGRTVSAGQARRLCLARTLLTGADILLLDEPTAGLNIEEECLLLADIAEATTGRTVLLATHAEPPPGCVDRVVRIAGGLLISEPAGSTR